MIFSLEVLQAFHGDCLILHFGTKTNPKFILIDGGPPGIYDNFLQPRLLEIKNKVDSNTPLTLSMVMVSHMDDDHANGICRLTDDIIQAGGAAAVQIDNLWINTFDDIVGNIQLPVISSFVASASAIPVGAIGIPGIKKIDDHELAVIASTGQGRQLRDDAAQLNIILNKPFKPLGQGKSKLVRGDTNQQPVKWEGLKITVVAPDSKRLEKLQKKWDSDLKLAAKKGDDSIIFASLLDNSAFNVSSIVCLVEADGKKILLTGDGRSDDIYAGLKKNKLLDSKGKLKVDILKMMHHGSIRNTEASFLDFITADHYIISANGRDDNPDKALLDLLLKKAKKGTVHLTNKEGKKTIKKDVGAFIKKAGAAGKIKVEVLAEEKTSFIINLLDKAIA